MIVIISDDDVSDVGIISPSFDSSLGSLPTPNSDTGELKEIDTESTVSDGDVLSLSFDSDWGSLPSPNINGGNSGDETECYDENGGVFDYFHSYTPMSFNSDDKILPPFF